MTDITYDPREADAVYIAVTRGKVEPNGKKAGPFIYDVDAEGRICMRIEVLSASKVLAPGDWKKAGPPKADTISAAE